MKLSELLKFSFKLLPSVKRPVRRVGFTEKLFWTGMILILYLIMSEVPLVGVPREIGVEGPLEYLRVVLASTRGTLMELGIGPIVTAGIIVQLLVGAKIIKLDLTKPEDRKTFTSLSKLLAILITVVQAVALVAGRRYGVLSFDKATLVVAQLFAAGVLIILMDELLQVGWGLGSGLSLFIAAGVAKEIFWDFFSPVGPMEDMKYRGAFLALFQSILQGEGIMPTLFRVAGPSTFSLIATIVVFLVLLYIEAISVDIPISHIRFTGLGIRYPAKLLYTSVIPAIFASILITDIQIASQFLWGMMPNAPWLRWLCIYDNGRLVGGLASYLLPPFGINSVMADPIRAFTYAIIFIFLCLAFSILWAQFGGLDASSVANQIIDSGLQIPGFRRTSKSIKEYLDQYLSPLIVISGILIGLIASLSDFLGVFGGGTGILLFVDIMYSYNEIVRRELLMEGWRGFPLLRR